MKIDIKTLKSWKDTGIREVSCTLVERGCAGEKIEIRLGRGENLDLIEKIDDVEIYGLLEQREFLRESSIVGVGGKWIVKNPKIANHCGCGSSFARKTGNPILDRARALKLQMRQKKEGVH